ncbi:hypothetical protein NQP46_20645 [Streptomyces albus]|nr:hypothetical protein NQP46_20645 [Streptomyces albus]
MHSVPEVMAVVAEQFARQGRPLKALEKRLEAHRRRVHEALAASGADAAGGGGDGDGASVVSSAVVRAGLVGVGMVPGVGAFAPVVDGERLARGRTGSRPRSARGSGTRTTYGWCSTRCGR